MEILEKITTEIAKIEEKKAELLKELSKDFGQIFKTAFENSNGKVTSFGWTQYSPHFNDGDECVFGVNSDYTYINGEHEDDTDLLDWRISYYLEGDKKYANLLTENPELDIDLYKSLQEFKKVLNAVPEEFLESLFGNHKKVTVYADGKTESEYYDHD